MINYNEITRHFADDIFVGVYMEQPRLYAALLLYKFMLGVEYGGISLLEYNGSNETSDTENTIIIGGLPIGDEYYNEYISAFINANIEESFQVGVYLDSNKKRTQITAVDDRTLRSSRVFNSSIQQIVLAIIEKIIPWHIQSTDEIRRMVPPLYAKGDFAAIDMMLEEQIEKLGVMGEIFDAKVVELNNKLFSSRIDNIELEITYGRGRIRELLREIERVNSELRENEALRVAVQCQKDDAEKPLDEVIEFVKSCNDIDFDSIDIESKKINFFVKTIICQTNMEDYANLVTENNGVASFFGAFDETTDEIKACMDAIFIDQIAKPHAVVNIGLDFERRRFFREQIEHSSYPKNHMSNPHINHYECFGSAVGPIQEYISKMRYADALNQIMYAAQQLTLSDSTVMYEFANEIKEYECIELPDGRFVDWHGLVEYLRSIGKIKDNDEEIIEVVEDEDLPLF